MTTNITIIGLGQIGASIGLAFADKKTDVRRVGHDKNPETAKLAQKQGAVDDIKYNLPASVKDAAVVILCLPLDQIRPTLEIIAQDLKEGAVVIDVSPAKRSLANWVKDILPAGRYYVGITPALNPAYLHEFESGVDAAHADLFYGATLLLDTPSRQPRFQPDPCAGCKNYVFRFRRSRRHDGKRASLTPAGRGRITQFHTGTTRLAGDS
jgi:prephenate dehydrogenase